MADEEFLVGTSMSVDEMQQRATDEKQYVSSASSVVTGMKTSALNSKESRAMEALGMKNEQLRIIGEQNSHLLKSMNDMDDQISSLKMDKLATEEENRALRDQNFELQSKYRAADAQMRKSDSAMEDKEKQIKVLTDHNSELLRLLENQESQTASLNTENLSYKDELENVRGKYISLLSTAKVHEEMANRAAREGQLRAEEVRLLRAEVDQLRGSNSELKMKSQVELESLQEQLRVRKEKQYQLLEKIQTLEEIKRQAQDQVSRMEEKMRDLHEKSVENETQLQLETRGKKSLEDSQKKMSYDVENLVNNNKKLQAKIESADQERIRMEAESRDTGEQLREMAEKVFQLLERLKLAELGKTKAVEALKRKESELLSLKKQNSRLLKESTKIGKSQVKAELDKQTLIEQIQALKTHNNQLSIRCRDEVKTKLKEIEEKKVLAEKIKTLGSRLSFLLNKMQADEEAKIISKEDRKKMSAQIQTMQERNKEVNDKLNAMGDSNRIITEAMRCKQEELDKLNIKFQALQKQLNDRIEDEENNLPSNQIHDDTITVDCNRVRFYVEAKNSQGVLQLQSRHSDGRKFLDKQNLNGFLKQIQKGNQFKQQIFEKLAQLLSLYVAEEDKTMKKDEALSNLEEQMSFLTSKLSHLMERVTQEEDAKRKTLLRYVHLAKTASTPNGSLSSNDGIEFPRSVLQLPESGIGDEEVHAIAALLGKNQGVKCTSNVALEINLRSNTISSDGARALAAILSASNANVENIDLRGNQIGSQGLQLLAEALERNPRVRHVYVHAGGKIEALGVKKNVSSSTSEFDQIDNVTTICVVDVRDQDEEECSLGDNNTILTDENAKKQAWISMKNKKIPPKKKSVPLNSENKKPKLGSQTKDKLLKGSGKKSFKKMGADVNRKSRQVAESKWNGRAGGVDIKVSKPNGDDHLPPISPVSSAMNRSTSAPVFAANVGNSPSKTDHDQKDTNAQKSISNTSEKNTENRSKKKDSSFSQRVKVSPLAGSVKP